MNEIREIAKETAERNWRKYAETEEELLLPEFLTSKNAQMFFRNRSIKIPTKGVFADFSIVISNKGHVRLVLDHYPDMDKAQENLEMMSEYFTRMNI